MDLAQRVAPSDCTVLILGPTATLMKSGKVLIAGGITTVGGPSASAEIYDPVTASFVAAASMSSVRVNHAAALLPSGQVLIAGGVDFSVGVLASAELYDPPTGLFLPTGPMSNNRYYHTATALPSGQVLMAGGDESLAGGSILTAAEIYEPSLQSFIQAGTMSAVHIGHAAALLSNGQVLVVGGDDGAPAELYSSGTPTWSPTGSVAARRRDHTATLLKGGRVLIAGGSGPAPQYASLNIAEVYDPASESFAIQLTPMSAARSNHTATLLPNGQVLLAGGEASGAPLASAELYDPATEGFIPTKPMNVARAQHTATLLSSGAVLVVGGEGAQASAEIFDPNTGSWSFAASMVDERAAHTATLLPSGDVLVTGGRGALGILVSAEVYSPVKNTWSVVSPMSTIRVRHTATLLPDGKVLVAGGSGPGGAPLATAEIFRFSALGSLCSRAGDCESGSCVDSVCCDSACDAGPCDVCAVRTDVTPLGGVAAGICSPLTGPACDDGDACTQTDVCSAGACLGADRIVCASALCQQPRACDPKTGKCSPPQSFQDGAFCEDGDICTGGDSCHEGACVPGAQQDCAHYACDKVSGCKHACDADEDCAVGRVCDRLKHQCKRLPCSSIADCATGEACDPTHQCVEAPPKRSSVGEPGCVCSSPGVDPRAPCSGAGTSLVVFAALFARRRRLARRS